MSSTKEKIKKLIFTLVLYSIFFCCNEAYGVTINGTVQNETSAPISDVIVKGTAECTTDDSGSYEVNISGGKIEYQLPKEYEDIKAVSETYIPKDTTKKYNIVIVKPENGFETEEKEIKNIFSNCTKQNEKIITYNEHGFNDGIYNPYQEYKKTCGDKYLHNDYINLFIVIGNENIPKIDATAEQGSLEDGNIFYNAHTNKLPQYMQISPIFEQIRQKIIDFAKIKVVEDELDASLDNSRHATVELKESINQRIRVTLTEKKEINIDGFISGSIYLDKAGARDRITKDEYGKELDNITAELIDVDGNVLQSTYIQDGQYGFEKPAEGKYKVKFKYNGQEFKAIDKEIDNVIDEAIKNDKKGNIEQELDREGFNNRNNQINNEKAKKILNWDEGLINIYAESIEFQVLDDIPPSPEDPEGYIDPDKYVNLVLEKRPEFEIEFKKEINIVKVTLADNTIYQENRMEDGTQEEQLKLRQVIMDEELMHGATIEIEYLITAKAKNDINIEKIKIIDYLDYENSKIEYNPNLKLLTQDNTNEDLGWEVVEKKEDLKDYVEEKLINNIDDGASHELKEREYLIGTLHEIDDKTYQTKLVVSKLISSSLEGEELSYSNSAEIIQYSNSEGRRMKWYNEENLDEKDKNIPGNFTPSYLSIEDYIDENLLDTSVSEDVFIIPPFGRSNNVFTDLNKYIEQKINFLNKGGK